MVLITYEIPHDERRVWGTATVTDGNWHHLVWINNSGRMSMYVDGVLQAEPFALTRNYAYNTFHFYSLGLAGSSARQTYLNGSLDELAYWEKALTQQEVTDLYNSGRGNTYRGGQ